MDIPLKSGFTTPYRWSFVEISETYHADGDATSPMNRQLTSRGEIGVAVDKPAPSKIGQQSFIEFPAVIRRWRDPFPDDL